MVWFTFALCHVGRVDAHYRTQRSLLQRHWVHQGTRLCSRQLTVATTRHGRWKVRLLPLHRRCQTTCPYTVTATSKFWSSTPDHHDDLSIRRNTAILGWTHIPTDASGCGCDKSMITGVLLNYDVFKLCWDPKTRLGGVRKVCRP